MIKGLDHGYHYTKDNELRIFKSAFTRTDTSLSEQNKITIDGVDYYYGRGNTTANTDKIDSTINKVCTLANLSLTGSGEYYLVVGLPIEQYASYKDKFNQMIMSYNQSEVIFKGKQMNLQIKDITVFAQGAGVLFGYDLPDGLYIVLDVGSYTINVVQIELINNIPHIVKFNTWYDGILTLYEKIVSETNRRYNTTLDLMDANRILSNGLNVNGTKVDIKFIDVIKQDYLDNILTKFKFAYPSYITIPILLGGGGGSLLQHMIENEFHNSILIPDSQFANAIGYYKFGLQKYQRKEVVYG
jgi:plasmid segregation protein ParM